jgi:RNA 3'-terminal phosphate cyclase
LVAESTTGCSLSTECVGLPGKTPEEIGKEAAFRLLAEIQNVR